MATYLIDFSKYDEVCKLFENNEDFDLEVEVEFEFQDENDGIGHYECWGMVGYDKGYDYWVAIDLTVENKILQKWLDDNQEIISNEIEENYKF